MITTILIRVPTDMESKGSEAVREKSVNLIIIRLNNICCNIVSGRSGLVGLDFSYLFCHSVK